MSQQDPALPRLNLPRRYPIQVRTVDGKEHIFDPLRRKYVRLTPEEWVRQNVAQFLIHDRGYPRGLMAIERGLDYYGIAWRADIVVCDKAGRPLLAAECKAPDIRIDQETFEQIARYNHVLRADCLLVTNGLLHYCYALDPATEAFRFLRDVPPYSALASPPAS